MNKKAVDISLFWIPIGTIVGTYLLLILCLIFADAFYALKDVDIIERAFADENILYSIKLSLLSCGITAILSLWVAIPAGYMFTRWKPKSIIGIIIRLLLDGLVDIPIVLPPLVIGISLLMLFRTWPFSLLDINDATRFSYTIKGLVLAQFVVGCAFAIRAMRTTFDHIPERPEHVARTLGASRAQTFMMISVPASWRGMVSAASIAWARSLGEFGPVLVFAGATRQKTEVLPTTVFLELSVGNLQSAVVISLFMVVLAIVVMILVRLFGERGTSHDRY